MNISNINVFKFKINKILLKKVGKNMLKQKEPVVFEPKNLESLIQGLDKKDLESLIKIIKYKIQINCLKNKWKSVGFKIPGTKKP